MIEDENYWREREEAENQDMMDRQAESQLDDFINNYGGGE